MEQENLLLQNLDQLHTTAMGAERIRRNLQIREEDVVGWCRKQIASPQTKIQRKGKNWYALTEDCRITINAQLHLDYGSSRESRRLGFPRGPGQREAPCRRYFCSL